MTQARFLKTPKTQLWRCICELALEGHEKHLPAVLTAPDEAQARFLDDLLWTWRQESFVPHLYWEGASEADRALVGRLSALITTSGANPARFSRIILGAPAPAATLGGYEEIVDFVIDDDDEAKEAARRRFRDYRELGFSPRLEP